MGSVEYVSIDLKSKSLGLLSCGVPFGERMSVEEDVTTNTAALADAFNAIFELMIDRPAGSGSFVTANEKNTKVGRMLADLTEVEIDTMGGTKVEPEVGRVFLLHKDDPERVVPTTMRNVYAMGGYRLKDLKKWSYMGLKYLLGIGKNVDLHAYDVSGDPVKANAQLQTLLQTSVQELGAKQCGYVCQLNYFGRMITNWVVDGRDRESGGYYFMLLPKDHRERYTKMLNYRIDQQTGKLLWSNREGMVVEVEKKPREKMAMVGESQDLGEWMMHTARAVRTMVMEGDFDANQIDIQSFISKLPRNKKIGFESAMGVMQNLMVAEENNPELTKQIVAALGLDKQFYYAQHPKEFSSAREKLVYEMDGAEMELLGQYACDESDSRLHMRGLAERMLRYMPLSVRQMERVIPEAEEREMISSKYVGVWQDHEWSDHKAWVNVEQGGRQFAMKKMYLETLWIFEDKIEEAKRRSWELVKVQRLEQGRAILYELAMGNKDRHTSSVETMISEMNKKWWEVRNNREWNSDLPN